MVVIFAAHWCPHCQKEIPLIQEWIDGGNLPDDVQVNLVSTGVKADQNNYPPSDWLSTVGWSEQIMLDNPDQSAAQAYGLTGYPYLVFVGRRRQGRAAGIGRAAHRAVRAPSPTTSPRLSPRPHAEGRVRASGRPCR